MNLSKVPFVFLFPVKVALPTPESWREKWRKGTYFFLVCTGNQTGPTCPPV